jgi:hypothetical protein
VDFTVKAQGPTLGELTARSSRALRTANRAAGREIAKAGRKAMDAVPKGQGRRFYGRSLRVKYKVDSSPSGAKVTFNPAKGQAGGWAIAEAGASAHLIRPHKRALRFAGRYAAVVHHPGTGGSGTWTRATKAVAKAVKPELEDLYEEALSGG